MQHGALRFVDLMLLWLCIIHGRNVSGARVLLHSLNAMLRLLKLPLLRTPHVLMLWRRGLDSWLSWLGRRGTYFFRFF